MQKRWNILQADERKVDSLAEALKINRILCKILVQRQIETFDQAREFFRPSLDMLHDPWLMKDMDRAVSRILRAIREQEKILIFGDYDVDGTTSVATVLRFLRNVYDCSQIDFYIPHRYREGYGISKQGIDYAKAGGHSLIIALDCGIKSIDLVQYARDLDIDFIICDHHLPDDVLPAATAILNPKQKDCSYPFKELCGCGVGFKLITALAQSLNLPREYIMQYIDLVATAIAADIVPMVGENRVLAFYGLKKANDSPNHGIKALKDLSGLQKPLQINNLVFMIAPRVNAAGRMDHARKAVQMFISESYDEALSFARMLHSDNGERKETDRSITDEALTLIGANIELTNRKSTVVFQSHWHKGVVGIVASRLMDHYYRPTVVLTQSGSYASGSARSVRGFNVYEAIHQCKDLLLGYGGHYYAAGMTLELNKVDAFRERFEQIVSETIAPELLVPEICIDTEIRLRDLRQSFYNILCQMEPFGPMNLRPVFVARHVMDLGSKVVKDQHIRFCLRQDNVIFRGIGFCMAEKFPCLKAGTPLDLVFTLDQNVWNNECYLQLKVIDVKPASPSLS